MLGREGNRDRREAQPAEQQERRYRAGATRRRSGRRPANPDPRSRARGRSACCRRSAEMRDDCDVGTGNTTVAAAAATHTAMNLALNQAASGNTHPIAAAGASAFGGASDLIAGLTSHKIVPVRTSAMPTENSTQLVSQVVAAHTPTTGPIMNEISTANGIQCEAGTPVLLGYRRNHRLPDDRERRHDEQAGQRGEREQQPVPDERRDRPADREDHQRGNDHSPKAHTVKQPPRHGPLIAMHTVAPASPARPARNCGARVATTCSVRTTPPAKSGTRTRMPRMIAFRAARSARTR